MDEYQEDIFTNIKKFDSSPVGVCACECEGIFSETHTFQIFRC